MPDARESSAERLIAALITVPIGIGAVLVDELPATVDRARRHVALARFIGKMTVEHAVQELQRRLAPAAMPSERPEPLAAQLVTTPAEPDVIAHVAENELALPDYDQLPAAHIVGKLAGLTPPERDDIEAYESAHRHRRTVLGKLDQLRAGGTA